MEERKEKGLNKDKDNFHLHKSRLQKQFDPQKVVKHKHT